MSWSVNLLGSPEGISKELDAEGERLTDQSKAEFLEAKPHLQGLVSQIVGEGLVRLSATGHATFKDGKKVYGRVSVTLDTLYGKICQ